MAHAKLFGSSIKRREDPRMITGRGAYTDDLKLPGQTHAAFVRSPHAHARVRRVDLSRAKATPGVVAAYTGKDLAAAGVGPLPCGWLLPDLKIPEYRGIATDKVNFVGHAVAVVIGETAYAALDGADQVVVDYDVLPAVVDGEKAVQPGAPQIHDNAPDNVAFRWNIGDQAKTDAAIKGAHRGIKQRLINHRLIPTANEPRASAATYNAGTGDLTCWVTSQNPHVHRLLMAAFVLGMPEHKVRVISGDVGGGFGSKIFLYPEEVAVSWASKQLGRPVKWTAERRESFMTDATDGTTSRTPSWRWTRTARWSPSGSARTRTSGPTCRPSRRSSRPSSMGRSFRAPTRFPRSTAR